MKTATLLTVMVIALLGLIGTLWSETVFTTEPKTAVRPRPSLRMAPVVTVPWGTSFDRVKTVGRWSRVSYSDTMDAFIYTEWLATCNIVQEKATASGGLEVHLTVGRRLGGPVLEAMCRHMVDEKRKGNPSLKEIAVEAYVADEYPKGKPLCSARWSAGAELQVKAEELPPVTAKDEEIYSWLGDLYQSAERHGIPIFACDSLWIEAGRELGMKPADVRFLYDRVRWSRMETVKTTKEK